MDARRRLFRYLILFMLGVAGWHFLDERSLPDGIPPLNLVQNDGCIESSPALVTSLGRHEANEFVIFTNGFTKQQVCSSGRLTFTAQGSLARGRGSHLVVSLQDQVLWEGEVLEPRDFELEVPGPGWLTLAFVNDHYNPPEDRNLYLSNLAFEAAPVSTP